MEIYNLLPVELQNKIKYYVIQHPIATIISEEINELRCNEYYTIRDKDNRIFCKIDGRDFFCGEYFLKHKKNANTDTDATDEYLDEVFDRMFFVSSSSSDDEE